MSKIQLQVGKRYVRRDGRITGALAPHNDLFIDANTTLTWLSDGSFYADQETAFDLVSEYTEPTLTNTAMKLHILKVNATEEMLGENPTVGEAIGLAQKLIENAVAKATNLVRLEVKHVCCPARIRLLTYIVDADAPPEVVAHFKANPSATEWTF